MYYSIIFCNQIDNVRKKYINLLKIYETFNTEINKVIAIRYILKNKYFSVKYMLSSKDTNYIGVHHR